MDSLGSGGARVPHGVHHDNVKLAVSDFLQDDSVWNGDCELTDRPEICGGILMAHWGRGYNYYTDNSVVFILLVVLVIVCAIAAVLLCTVPFALIGWILLGFGNIVTDGYWAAYSGYWTNFFVGAGLLLVLTLITAFVNELRSE